MAQPSKQPLLAAWVLTMLAVMVMLVVAIVVNLRHSGSMPSILRLSAVAPAAYADRYGASGFGGDTV